MLIIINFVAYNIYIQAYMCLIYIITTIKYMYIIHVMHVLYIIITSHTYIKYNIIILYSGKFSQKKLFTDFAVGLTSAKIKSVN